MVHEDCLVILLQSPSSNVWRPPLPIKTRGVEVYGLQLEELDLNAASASSSSMLQYAPAWLMPIGSNTVCAMTGLAVDVEHLGRVLHKQAQDHHGVFGTPLTTHALTQKFAAMLQERCLLPGSRPYGVQAMMVGCDDVEIVVDGGDEADDDGRGRSTSLCLYSMDPSGSWQAWAKGTAIGKYGPELRRLLGRKLVARAKQQKDDSHGNGCGAQDEEDDNETEVSIHDERLEGAVKCLLECWRETCQKLNINMEVREDYQVLVLQRRNLSGRRPQQQPQARLFCVTTKTLDQIAEQVNAKLLADGKR